MNDDEFQVHKQRLLGPDCFELGLEEALAIVEFFEQHGETDLLTTALDLAWELSPYDASIAKRRQELLTSLAVVEHGITFRYIPAGRFLMGSDSGEADERPVHEVMTGHYWISDIPVTWTRYCALMGWEPPPKAMPEMPEEERMKYFQRTFRTSHHEYLVNFQDWLS